LFGILLIVLGIDTIWAVGYTLWPKKSTATQPAGAAQR